MKTLLLISFSFFLSGSMLCGQDIKPHIVPPDMKKQFPDTLNLRVTPDVKNQFPGSSRFYRKETLSHPFGYEKSFIKRPDTSARYFLIIKDPLTNKVTRW